MVGAADVVVHTNLAIADVTSADDGLLPEGVHLRVDDVWQAGGVWRTQRLPIAADVLATDPREPLGLGYRGVTATPPVVGQQPSSAGG